MLYLPWDLNLGELDPKHKILWFYFVSKKDNHSLNFIFNIFKHEAIFMLGDEAVQTNNLKSKYIMKVSEQNHLQQYMTSF